MKKIARYRKPRNYSKIFLFLFIFLSTLTGGVNFELGGNLLSSLFTLDQALANEVLINQCKNTLQGANVTLIPIGGGDPTKTYIWFGTFGNITGMTPQVYLQEGRNTVTYYVDNGTTFIDKQSFDVMVYSCLAFSDPVSDSEKVKLSWSSNPNATKYEIYRAHELAPTQFNKIAEVPLGKKSTVSYTDSTVENSNLYAYIIGELMDGSWKYSMTRGANPAKRIQLKDAKIWAPHQTISTAGTMYSYDINAVSVADSDGNFPYVIYELISYPSGMTITPYEGRIQWTPEAPGSYPVRYQLKVNGFITQEVFTINVYSYPTPLSVNLMADPLTLSAGETTHLSWDSAYAENITIDQVIGNVSATGSMDISIQNDTTFTITGSVLGNTVSDSVTVKVGPSVSFQAAPQSIPSGGTSYLTWTSVNADTVSIDQGIGSVDLNSTEQGIPVSPTGTTTYTITATGPGGTTTQQATVTVVPPPTVSFDANPLVISPGGTSSLTWTSTNADTVSIDNGIGTVSASGSLTVSPLETTIYTMTATGIGGTETSQATVTVAPQPTVTLSAAPQTIAAGESATLSWTSGNAHTVSIDNSIGAVALNGSIDVSPAVTTTYTMTATGTGGTTTSQVTITVIPGATVTLSANPQNIAAGETVTLSWTSSNADIVIIDNGIGTVSLNGSLNVSPTITTIYTITAQGTGGTATDTATVTIIAPPTATLDASPQTIQAGEPSTLSWTTTNADSVIIDPNIGSVSANGSISVYPTQTTTYTLTATGFGGTVQQSVTVTISPISLSITLPSDGEIINRSDVMVQGTINNAAGVETGVTVNGVAALIYGNEFAANHVPLQEGENTLTVTAMDTDGNISTAAINVTADTNVSFVKIDAIPEIGISPFETTLKISGTFGITESSIAYTGPGPVTFLGSGVDEYKVSMVEAGNYYFTVDSTHENVTYTDTVAVMVADQNELDLQLKAVFNGVKNSLAAGDTEKAVGFFTLRSHDKYLNIFNANIDNLQEISAGMQDIEMIYVHDDVAKYRIYKVHDINGELKNITYYIYFRMDVDGIWKIELF